MHTFLCLLGFLFKLFEAFLQLNPLSLCVLTSLLLPLQLGPAETDIIRGEGKWTMQLGLAEREVI